jgi:hypothetical protein
LAVLALKAQFGISLRFQALQPPPKSNEDVQSSTFILPNAVGPGCKREIVKRKEPMLPTVDAVLLLGWMEKEEAIPYLLEQCWFEPKLTIAQAEEVWQKYKNAVDALPVRNVQRPKCSPIPLSQKKVVEEFLKKVRGPEVLNVLNLDPMALIVYQLYVVADRADHHAKFLSGRDWARVCLQTDRPILQMATRMDNGILKVNLPHAEHLFTLLPDGAFRIQQGGGFISVCELEGRLLLKAGYHRSFASSRARRNEPDAKERSLLVALTKTVPPQLLPAFPKQGLRTTVLGSKPPLLSDFFDESLAMTVKLRKKRYEMHIKADLVPVDET